jgi:YidC/Oxa1 family membrane protein insertase
MNRKDLPLLLILVALWLAWPHIDRKFIRKYFPEPPPAAETAPAGDPAGPAPADARPAEAPAVEEPPPAFSTEADPEPPSAEPEQIVTLRNDHAEFTFSSRGAALVRLRLLNYPTTAEPGSEPLELEMVRNPALVYRHLAGLSAGHGFSVEVEEADRRIRFERTAAHGLRLRRTVERGERYVLRVTDELINDSERSIDLPPYGVQVGEMRNLPSERLQGGLAYLGVDMLLQAGEGVAHWGDKIPKWFEKQGPHHVDRQLGKAADWVATKNKFFVQIFTPEDGLEDCVVQAARDPQTKAIDEVWATALFQPFSLGPGNSLVRSFEYYAGPKKLSELRKLGPYHANVMGFFLAPIGKFLLTVLNLLHDNLWPHNYGLAIMLLTIIIRVLFWPLTFKSTESMKRMAELQPLMQEIRQKFKDNPQKQQQAMMALYKEHKVNPMMGCLPMLVQIPVFIALFYVLRSAIELRFAHFLWVRDLSEPEMLWAGVLGFPLNILPLVMAGTTLWQQRLTPTTGDPAQQKIMMFMPLLMLVFLYNFASGLVLYWTTNNVLMIIQQLLQKRKRDARQAAK